eukprot:1144851-Pelagomonas_calceolata.AAC.7
MAQAGPDFGYVRARRLALPALHKYWDTNSWSPQLSISTAGLHCWSAVLCRCALLLCIVTNGTERPRTWAESGVEMNRWALIQNRGHGVVWRWTRACPPPVDPIFVVHVPYVPPAWRQLPAVFSCSVFRGNLCVWSPATNLFGSARIQPLLPIGRMLSSHVSLKGRSRGQAHSIICEWGGCLGGCVQPGIPMHALTRAGTLGYM